MPLLNRKSLDLLSQLRWRLSGLATLSRSHLRFGTLIPLCSPKEFKYYSTLVKGQPVPLPLVQVDRKLSFVNIRFIGVGFRGYIVTKKQPNECSNKELNRFIFLNENEYYIRCLMLKVGQSALTAYPIPASIEVFCPKDQQADKQAILLIGENLQELKQVAAEIKSYKKPDPYKGSGVYETQRIETEEGEIFKDETVFRKVMKKK